MAAGILIDGGAFIMSFKVTMSRNLVGGQGGDESYTYDNRYYQDYAHRIEARTDRLKRPRPVGVEALFDGTSVYSQVTESNPVVWIEEYHALPPSTAWSSATQMQEAASINNGYGLDIPDKYWVNELRNKLRDTDINLAQSFAERGQTEKMFVDYGRRVLKAYTSLRRGNVNGVFNALLGTGNRPYKGWKGTIRDATGVASDSWLAFQYGIRPLISDLNGAVSEYWKVRGARPLVRRYSLRCKNDERGGGTLTPPGELWTTEAVQNANVVCYAQFQDGASAWDASADRLGLTNPVLLAWELIPLSFVFDWFVNVGSFLEASGTIVGLQRVGIHVTTRTVERSSVTKVGKTGTLVIKTVSRSFRNLLPPPELRVKAFDLSIPQITSALALIRQRL